MEVNKVRRWRRRYVAGLAGIGKQRSCGGNQGGRSDSVRDAPHSPIVETATGLWRDATHWSCRTMARKVGASRDFVIQAHLSRTVKRSTDPTFEKKLRDVVGLYLDPPENAVVFSFDEKSSIQTLNRTQPELPMKKGRDGTMRYDYKRYGKRSLFAELNVASGGEDRAGGAGHPHRPRQLRHQRAPWLKPCRALLPAVDREASAGAARSLRCAVRRRAFGSTWTRTTRIRGPLFGRSRLGILEKVEGTRAKLATTS